MAPRKNRSKKAMVKKKAPYRWQAAPLKASFMVLAVLGFLITAYLIVPASFNFGVAFMVLFIIMFIASLISMSKEPVMGQ